MKCTRLLQLFGDYGGAAATVWTWGKLVDVGKRAWHTARATPSALLVFKQAVIFFAAVYLMNLWFKSVQVGAEPVKIAQARRALDALDTFCPKQVWGQDMSAAVRRGCLERNNVAFLGNFLSKKSANELAYDLNLGSSANLTLVDSGAAINASVGHHPIEKG